MTTAQIIALGSVLFAALAILVTLVRQGARDRRDTIREQLQRELAARDVAIANLQGQLTALKDTIESFARAFVDRRHHPHE